MAQRTETLECGECGSLLEGQALVLDDQGIPLTSQVLDGLQRMAAVSRLPASAMAHPAVAAALLWVDGVTEVYGRAADGDGGRDAV